MKEIFLKNKIVLIVITAAILSIGGFYFFYGKEIVPGNTQSPIPEKEEQRTFTYGPEMDLNGRIFRIIPEGIQAGSERRNRDEMDLIAVYEKESSEPVQILKGRVDYSPDTDIRLLRDVNVKNSSHNYWLFDPTTDLYVFDETTSQIYGPYFDPEKKEIISSVSCGMAGACRLIEIYRLIDNKVTLVRSEHYDLYFPKIDKEGKQCEPLQCEIYTRTIKELRGDQMITVSSEEQEYPFEGQ